ncbi:MAG: dihydroorotate dehydrogenase electron transfer subunit [bacterium]
MNNMRLENAKVIEHKQFRNDYRLLVLECPGVGLAAKPGQFVHLRIPGQEPFILRRPFSIFKADDRTITLLYKKIGRGTTAMESIRDGDLISLLGPLGNGFPLDRKGIFPVVVGGGYGVAAMYLLAKQFPQPGAVFIGGRKADDILCVGDFEAMKWQVHLSTEDGSAGSKGLVTELLESWFAGDGAGRNVEIFACGPDGMLKAVTRQAEKRGLKAWISLDTHMGCGVGVCLACVCKTRDEKGNEQWGRVCKEGPVFECRRIVWSDDVPTKA